MPATTRSFAARRAEARRLAEDLADDEVRLVPIAYPRLWEAWASELSEHVSALRARYAVHLHELAEQPTGVG
jgi:hypothetical protein